MERVKLILLLSIAIPVLLLLGIVDLVAPPPKDKSRGFFL
jgi:hypothetical protein